MCSLTNLWCLQIEQLDPSLVWTGDDDFLVCAGLYVNLWCMQVEFYPHHGYLNISLTVWLGIYLFFIIERCLKIFMDSKARRRGEVVVGHSHSHPLPSRELENLINPKVPMLPS